MAAADRCLGKVDPGMAFSVPGNGKVDLEISLANSKSDSPDPELARVIKSSTFSILGPRPSILGEDEGRLAVHNQRQAGVFWSLDV